MSRHSVVLLAALVLSACREQAVSVSRQPPALETSPKDAAGQPGPMPDAASGAGRDAGPAMDARQGGAQETGGEVAGSPGDASASDGSRRDESLVLHLRMDESPGSTRAMDSSGRGNHGTLVGATPATAWPEGRQGRALGLAGRGEHLLVASSVSLNGIFRAFTVTAHVQISGTPAERSTLLSRQGAYALGLASGRPYLSMTLEGRPAPLEVAALDAVPAGRWVQVAGVFDGTGVARLFLDGKEVGSLAVTGTIGNSLAALTVGARLQGTGTAEPFTGKLDDVRLHAQALSPAELGQLASQP